MMRELVASHVLPATLALLPPEMDTVPARALIFAIGLQESRYTARRQRLDGPARGFWQFELAGVRGVLQHRSTSAEAHTLLIALQYPSAAQSAEAVHRALEHNDILACGFARLLLWTLPFKLPDRDDHGEAWSQYLAAWRPGKPHHTTWPALYDQAWDRIATGPSRWLA